MYFILFINNVLKMYWKYVTIQRSFKKKTFFMVGNMVQWTVLLIDSSGALGLILSSGSWVCMKANFACSHHGCEKFLWFLLIFQKGGRLTTVTCPYVWVKPCDWLVSLLSESTCFMPSSPGTGFGSSVNFIIDKENNRVQVMAWKYTRELILKNTTHLFMWASHKKNTVESVLENTHQPFTIW